MVRKAKSVATAGPTLSQVKERLARALGEGRTMQALDLAKQVYRAEPDAANRDVLFKAYIARGRELRGQNRSRDAVTTLQNAVAFVDGDATRVAALAT